MDMPDLKPIAPPKPRTKWITLACFAVFVVAIFAFAFFINLPEWR